jgi:predicted RNA-binding protein (TIGR00451 family)
MIKEISDFGSLFGSGFSLNEELIVKKQNRYFLLNEVLKKSVSKDFFCAGIYLGRTVEGKLFPSFELLRLLGEKKANKIIVDKKTEWLFICGRDIFKQGIVNITGATQKGDHVLVLNNHGECLGFGRIVCDLSKTERGLAVKNILDIGDFLRREKET